MSDPHLEEDAAVQPLGLLDEVERERLSHEAARDAVLRQEIAGYAETAALLAYDAPQVAPPPALEAKIMRRLGRPGRSRSARIIQFPAWIPYALAACLMGLVVYQANQIFTLSRQVGAEHAGVVALQQRNDMAEVRLASLEAKDAAYGSTKMMVAWDPQSHHGVVSIQNLPAPPAGHDYQLWVLDPAAPAPISAGLLRMNSGSQGFAVEPVKSGGPGFAVSLEPAGGRPSPTGAILFAVAPVP